MKRKTIKRTAIALLLTFAALLAAGITAFASEEAAAPGLLDTEELFSDRDMNQAPDLTDAVTYTLTDGADIEITAAGVYVLTGSAKNASVTVNAAKDDKVQLVLDGVSVENDDSPVISVLKADKVFVTTSADSTLSVTGAFTTDGGSKADGVIFSKADLVLNGTAALTVNSYDNGVVCKDDLKLTGGTYTVNCYGCAFEANDSILVGGGTYTINAGTDGLHAENSDDPAKGYICITDGSFTITCGDDAVHALSFVQIDGGTLDITAAEGIEATYILIRGGKLSIAASDDGINGARKSSAYSATVEITGGEITIVMGAGDTDGIDCNGDVILSGGTVDITGGSTVDYDGTGTFTGGTLILNGQQAASLPNQMASGGMGRGRF